MRKALAFALVAVALCTAAVLHPHLPVVCSGARRLDRLLGGGPPICLGGNSSQLDHYRNENRYHSSCDLVQHDSGGEYWYAARRDDALCHHAGPVVTGCVTIRDGARALALARAATARSGGTWRLVIVRTPAGMMQQRWTSEEGLVVSNTISFDASRTVCIEDKSPHS